MTLLFRILRAGHATGSHHKLALDALPLLAGEHAEGWSHVQDDLPMLICGKGGGRLRGNIHYRQEGGSASRALLTALRGGGLPITEFGHEEGSSDEPITELETG